MRLEDFNEHGGKLRVVRPMDPVAFWDLEVAASDVVWHYFPDVLYECADYLTTIPQVTDVPYDGDSVIPVCGSISFEELTRLVTSWWEDRISELSVWPDGF